MHKEGIAIIGIGCRFPGGVNNTESFWKLLADGRDAVSEVPPDRWNVSRFYDPEKGLAGKSIAKRGGFIEGIDQFDPQFFGISPREAPYVDPQHRLLLETAWEAIEDAGLVLDFERGTDLSVFVGISHNDYQIIQGTPWDSSGISPHSPTGTAHSIAANRISYCLNLRGASLAVDTACSSALTAVHLACEHIWAGRGISALAGGVTVMITPGGFIGFSQASMLSPDGACKAFDAAANGFVRGEGAGMVLVKKLSQAIADGDPIQAVIIGTSMNQDGHTNGISLPSPEAQARLVRDACADAGISPAQVGFVEAHGTGTAVGDPIEANALSEALCADRPADRPLLIGSVKSNLGHLETAAGLAGLFKAALALKHRRIPGSLHFDTPNPHIDLNALKMRVPVKAEEFPEIQGMRVAGVNSFGFGGSNSHVLLTEAPARPRMPRPEYLETHAQRAWPLMLSARSENALGALTVRMSEWLDEKSRANGSAPVLPDLTYSLGARRNHHPHRLTLIARSLEDAAQQLRAHAAGEAGPKVRAAFTPRPEQPPRIAFVMSGQGPQWWGMGRELMQHEPVFRRAFQECEAAMQPWTRFSLSEELNRSEADSQLHRTEVGQPAIFAMQVALAALWRSWGVEPAAVVGHSVGEIAAACVAGVLSLEQAAQVIALRARFMGGCARGEGMLAVGLGEEEVQALISRHDRTVTIAAFNGPRALTLSGRRASLQAMAAELEPKGVFARIVRVEHPFHHPMMQPAADELEAALADLAPGKETVPFFSTVTGQRHFGEACRADHWAKGVRQPVLFAPAVAAMAEHGVDVWLEVNAHPALIHSLHECLAGRGGSPVVFASVRREREHDSLLETALDLHRAGVELDFKGMTPSRRFLSLPAYTWDRSRWWNEANDWREGRLSPGGRGLLDVRLPRATPTWVARLDQRHLAYLKDHRVENFVVFPAAAFVEIVLEAGMQMFEGRPFVVEDLEIRKPLIVPESPAGLTIEISYDPSERSFSIQSRMDQASAWSIHVVGSMRGERTDSAFAASMWTQPEPSKLHPVAIDGFYGHMSDMGLRYGEEFRPIRELFAGCGESAGKVLLTEAIGARASEYLMHPVLFDGALQVFSAGAATVEGRKPRMKLPVRFARILFLRSPGASSYVRAGVQQFNSELIEGGIGIYDEAGKPCVLVDGFRAISMAAARRSGAPNAMRDLLYHIEWARTPSLTPPQSQAPIPLAELHKVAGTTLEEVIGLRGRTALEATMADEDELAVAQIAKGLSAMGVESQSVFSADSLGIAEPMRTVFQRLMAALAKRGLLERDGAGYRATEAFPGAAHSAGDVLHAFLSKHPGHLPEGLLCATTCAELGPILRGEKDAVQVLFTGAGADLLEQFYGDGLFASHWMASIASAVGEAARRLPEGRGLRILEVGAGTGGLTAHLLPLLERGLHSYIFTDVSAGFFPAAMQKLAAFPEVECKVFDLEKSGLGQGFEPESFDFIVGTNVLHAVSDVRAALRRIHELLAPGGTLMFMDVATPQVWTESVFGLTSGWWSLVDRDLRPEHPLLQREQWEQVLREAGFEETASLPGLIGPQGGEGQIGVLARKAWQPEQPVEWSLELPAETGWLVFADTSGLGEKLAGKLAERGAPVKIVRSGAAFSIDGGARFTVRSAALEDWNRLVDALAADRLPDRLVYLWSMDEPDDPVLMGTDALLHLTQALETKAPSAKIRIDLVTRGAQPAGCEPSPLAVAAGAAVGVFRVILSEHPGFICRGIDLPPQASVSDLRLLCGELLQGDAEREIAFRGEARYVQRIGRGVPARERWLDRSVPLRLESRERGALDSLRLAPFALPACGEEEVLIEVRAAGMNFRDVLKALALYPAETADARIFGDEVAGIVSAVGAGVRHIQPGDRVFGLAVFGLATHAMARAGDIRRIPANLSFEEAATLPVVFMTAWHALYNVARIRPGEKVLVHAGAGGVGMAAIQIAHHLGAEVIASAGSPAKRALLELMGVKHVIDSRRGDFADAVMGFTGRRGVDVVLNSLAGEAIPMGLACLAEFGRFIEIGKRDIYQNSRIPLWPLRKNASFHVVAMDAVFHGDANLTREILGEIAQRVEQGALKALPFRAFPACRIDAAFRLMAQGRHTGKVIVTFSESLTPRRAEPLPRTFEIKSDGCYLITGAFGGFGKVVAEWLIDCGARHLVLASRSGASTPEAEAFLQRIRSRGAEVAAIRADVGSPEGVKTALAETRALGRPLKGIFHLAMVIDDAPLGALTAERMRTVLAPKAYGAWLLHEETRDQDLDCFVMFSSVSSVFGNPGQGNYAAANAFLDALAHHRHALGLPALAVNWGVLGGEGYVARNERVAEFLARQGTSALSPGEVMSILESALVSGVPQVAAIRVDWTKWRQFFRGLQQNPLLERVFASDMESQTGAGVTGDWRRKIEAAPAGDREALIRQALREIIGSVLRVKPESLRDEQPLTDLGLDSLMGVEIENSIESAIGVALPPASLLRARTIGQIGARIAEHLGGKPAVEPPPVVVAPTDPAPAEEVDLDALSDDDIGRLLEPTPAASEKPRDSYAL